MKKTVLALLLSVLAIVGAPSSAHAIGISFSYNLNYYPPNPCVDSSLSSSIGIYDLTGDGSIFIPSHGQPDTSCGSSSSGAFSFDVSPGALLYLSFEGAIQVPDPGPPDAPVFAFPNGTNEADEAVSIMPSSAPLIFIGEVNLDGILIPNLGPQEFPLFAFSSPGTQVGSLTVATAPVPEPGTLLLIGSGLAGLIAARKRFLQRHR